jgi:hypothetical protein
MLEMLLGYTSEADDAEAAVAEVLERADIENKLLKNSVGLLFCNVDFIESGIVDALCGRLPFKVAGCTTQGFGMSGISAQFMLVLAVLTSDTLEFSLGLSSSLALPALNASGLRPEDAAEERLRALYARTSASLTEKTSMMFVFQPMLFHLPGDVVNRVLDRVSGGVPLFGSIALDMPTKIRSPQVIYNGLPYGDRLAVLLLSGPVSPRFFMKTVQPKNSQSAIITRVEGNKLISINNLPAVEYLDKLGVTENGKINTFFCFVASIRFFDGKVSTCVFYDVTPEGHLVCGNMLETGGILSIGAITSKHVLDSAGELIEEVREACFEEQRFRNGLLLFSCITRNVVLPDSEAEAEFIRNALQSIALPYLFVYSGGEFCPGTENGKELNRFQQYTIVACLL